MKLVSPLRYPGGKASLSGFLTDIIDLNDMRGAIYFEPYAGGAGAALTLLDSEVVSSIFINDVDRRVFAFWKSALHENERFVDKVMSISLTIDEWYRQRTVCLSPELHSLFDTGFSAFFMNRCNRSGVLSGAGPIGGYKQNGKWRLDARFNRETLAERLIALGRAKDRICVSNLDAIDFLETCLPKSEARKNVFVYLDPPYVNRGQRLYFNSYDQGDHAKVAKYLVEQETLLWVMSYDDTNLIRDLYKQYQICLLPIRYSLQKKYATRELVIAPERVMMPRSCKVSGIEMSMVDQCIGGATQ